MSYKHRRDNRTEAEFKKAIKSAHEKEAVFAEAYRIQLEQANGVDVVYEPYGCGPDGEVIKGHISDDGDAKYYIGSEEKIVEIKTCPEYLTKFFTFKVSALKKCIKNNATLLVVKKGEFWTCSDAKLLKEMVDFLEHKIYYAFSPNDLAVRLNKELIEHYFNNSEWSTPALEYIESNEMLL